MRVVALVNQKGGSGKSTLAACLAVAAQEAGERVFLIDMDPQKSLLKWGHRRQDKDLPVEAVMYRAAQTPVTLTFASTNRSPFKPAGSAMVTSSAYPQLQRPAPNGRCRVQRLARYLRFAPSGCPRGLITCR